MVFLSFRGVRSKYILPVFLFFSIIAANLSAQMNTTRLLSIGRSALYYEDYIIAMQYFNRVIRLKPYLYEPYILRAIAKIQLEDFNGALLDCNDALERNPYQAGLYYTRGFVYRQLAQYEKAEQDFTEALRYAPDNRTYLLLRADVLSRLNKFDSAMIDINYLLAKEPQSGALHFEKGAICLAMQDTTCAENEFKRSTQYDSQNASNWSALGMVNLMKNDFEEALANLNHAIKLGSKWEGDYINRAIISYHKHNYNAALSDYGKALTINPNDPQIYYNRAILRQELGDLNNALEDINKAVQYADENTPYLYQRAIILLQLQQWEQALTDLDSLIAKYPYFLPSYYLSSQAYTALGQKTKAYQSRQTAYNIEQKKDSLQAAMQQTNSPNTDVQLAQGQPSQRDRRKEFSPQETQADIQPEDKEKNNALRGSIQHKNVDVINEPNLFLTYYAQKSNLRQTNYSHPLIEAYNTRHRLPSQLFCTAQQMSLNSEIINRHFDQITSLSTLIEQYEKAPDASQDKLADLYFSRAFEFATVHDYFSAVENCTKALALKPNEALIYFCRAVWRYQHIEFEKSATSFDKLSIDLNIILKDYESVIKLQPDFSFAYYNKANLLCLQKRYAAAIETYTKAIETDNDFAEAYFNRGLTYIYTNHPSEGIADLSKAGELGIYQAYNLITRFR